MKLQSKVNVPLECGSGWDKIIEPVIDYIDDYNKQVEDEDKKIKILQIKEKFGGLRIYCHNKTEKLRELIEDAEEKSFNTCEICGSTEDVGQTSDGWIMTCCRNCVKKAATAQNRIRKWYSRKNRNVENITPNYAI